MVASQFLNFALVGGLGFLVDAACLQAFLNIAGLDPYLGRAGSFLVAVTFTWAMNRKFTFQSSDQRFVREWSRFFAANSLGAIVNLGVYGVLVGTSDLVSSHPVLGVAAGSVAGLAVNFMGSRFLVFRQPRHDESKLGLLAAWRATEWTPAGREAFGFWVLMICALYAVLCLSPSSYGVAFQEMLGAAPGLVAGTPKGLRSDEWSVWTPFMQIAVNNGFLRFNETSPYLEDLRNFNALPLLDWGLLFKPQFLGFFVFDPAWAFSFHHSFIIGAFLIGWERLFRRFGFNRSTAVLGALIAFFLPYTQLWWTTTGPLLAGFPWLILCFLWEAEPWKRVVVMAWLIPVWVISHLYPPIIISLAFAGVVMLLAFEPRRLFSFRYLAPALAGCGIGFLIVFLYLGEAISVMAETVYPGKRALDGGEVPILLWLSTFIPDIATHKRNTVYEYLNYLEGSAAGSYLLLLSFVFADWRRSWRAMRSGTFVMHGARWKLLVLAGGVILISCWLLAPVPASVGRILLWDKVPGPRFLFALGAIVLLVSMILLDHLRYRITLAKIIVAIGGIYGVGLWVDLHRGQRVDFVFPESWALVSMLLVFVAALGVEKARERPGLVIGLASVLAGIVMFGTYNPLQSAYPIFHRPESPLQARYDALQGAHPKNYFVMQGPRRTGAIFNAWGFRSISHVLVAPRLEFFREIFTDMEDQIFNYVFNRYAHVTIDEVRKPDLPQPDVIRLPRTELRSDVSTHGWVSLTALPFAATKVLGGNIEKIEWRKDLSTLIVSGWAMTNGLASSRTLSVHVPGDSRMKDILTYFRNDVSEFFGNDRRLVLSGFTLAIEVEDGYEEPPFICAWSDDDDFGQRMLMVLGKPADRKCSIGGN